MSGHPDQFPHENKVKFNLVVESERRTNTISSAFIPPTLLISPKLMKSRFKSPEPFAILPWQHRNTFCLKQSTGQSKHSFIYNVVVSFQRGAVFHVVICIITTLDIHIIILTSLHTPLNQARFKVITLCYVCLFPEATSLQCICNIQRWALAHGICLYVNETKPPAAVMSRAQWQSAGHEV